jgi:hypothetical protein
VKMSSERKRLSDREDTIYTPTGGHLWRQVATALFTLPSDRIVRSVIWSPESSTDLIDVEGYPPCTVSYPNKIYASSKIFDPVRSDIEKAAGEAMATMKVESLQEIQDRSLLVEVQRLPQDNSWTRCSEQVHFCTFELQPRTKQ